MANNSTLLTLPIQALDSSCCFTCTEAGLAIWLETLPLANPEQAGRQLHDALAELHQVHLSPGPRMALLEQLRRTVQRVSTALTSRFNKQSSAPVQQLTQLILTLPQQLTTGYQLVAAHSLSLDGTQTLDTALAVLSLHRACSELTLMLQRHQQCYQLAPAGAWLTLHQLYAMGRQQQLHRLLPADDSHSCLETVYIGALLCACAKPNQLRQDDFISLHQQLTSFAKHCRITTGDEKALFTLNPQADSPPAYRQLSDPQHHWLDLDTEALAEQLRGQLRQPQSELLTSPDLLKHLLLCWGGISTRNFMRHQGQEDLDLCVGLSAVHHYLSGEQPFAQQLQLRDDKIFTGERENLFLKVQQSARRSKNISGSRYQNHSDLVEIELKPIDEQLQDTAPAQQQPSVFKRHRLGSINTSAQGFCLLWPRQNSVALKTGDIVGINVGNAQAWNIAVIRWLEHGVSNSRFGLQLISPSAVPYAARPIKKKAVQADYMRALLLPELATVGRPACLLTPTIAFVEGQRVMLNQHGRKVQVDLGKKLNQQGAYQLFTVTRRGVGQVTPRQPSDDPAQHQRDDAFDTLWL